MLLTLLTVQALSVLGRVDDSIRPQQDVLDYRFAVVLSDHGSDIRARASVRFHVVAGDGGLVLDLDGALRVEHVIADGVGIPFIHEGDSLQIASRGTVGDTLEVEILYAGSPRDGLLIGPTARGGLGVFADNWPERARHWLPVNDHPSDKAAVAWEVEAPAGWRVVANGVLRDTTAGAAGRVRWVYEEPRPLPTYTFVIGAGVLAVGPPLDAGAVPQRLWTYPEDSIFAVTGPFRRVGNIVTVLEDVIGPFPYDKLAHVQSRTRFGGMENAGAIFYTERGFVQRTMSERLVVHETAHQWFGDAVTPRDWHHLWLSEGFATYFDALFYEIVGEHRTFRASMQRKRERYLASDVLERPILDFEVTNPLELLSPNTYQKAAWVLHMLRREVGDSAFGAGLRAYYEQYRDSTAVSADFVAVMEAISGKDLESFFMQWLAQPGYPQLEVTVERFGRSRRGRMRLVQKQPEAWGSFAVPVRVDLLATASRQRTSSTLHMRSRDASLEITLPEGADSILVDPAGDVLLSAQARWK